MLRPLLLAALLLGGPRLHADTPFMMNPGAFANQMAIPSMVERLERDHRLIFGRSTQESLRAGKGGKPAPPPAAAPGAGPSRMPARLAAAYPAEQRQTVEQTFAELLRGYGRLERELGLPPGDLAGALAAFLTGNYAAYRDVEPPDSQFPALVRQMRELLAARPEIAALAPAQKRELYEQWAIVGMLVASTQLALKEKPDPTLRARLREAAGGYLRGLLQVDPRRVRLGEKGLSIE